MRNKKLLSIAMAASVVLSTTSTVFASSEDKTKLMETSGEINTPQNPIQEQQAKITKAAAKEIGKAKLKEYLGYDLDESKFQVQFNFRPSYNNTKDDYVWDIYWTANDALKSTTVRISLNANSGKVISAGVNIYPKLEPQPTVPSITREKAKESAEAFMNKVFPEELKDLKLVDNSMDNYMNGGYQQVNYSFNYQRYYNGVLLDGNFVTVLVDGINGSVMSFDSNWSDNLSLPNLDGIITKEKAEALFKAKTQMNLLYLPYRDKYQTELQPNSIKLVYDIGESSSSIIDAKTGSIINANDPINQQTETKDLTDTERAAWLKKAGDLKPLASEIDSAEAEKVMLDKIKEIYGETYKLEYLSYEENKDSNASNSGKSWRANFYKEVDGKRTDEGGNIAIDALTEGILSLYKYDNNYKYDEEFTPKLTWAEAYNKAIEAAAKYFPDKIKDIKTEQKNISNIQIVNGKQIPQREYNFNFPRLVNNIPYRNDNITITFDAKTGILRQIGCQWSNNIVFPSANGAMSSEDAKAIYFQKYNPELAYTLNQTTQSDGKLNTEYKLVYRLKPANSTIMGQYIDAFNGKLVNYDGQEILEQSSEFFNKIKGNKYEKELTILAFQGIIDTNNFELNKEVTSLDFIKMLVDAKGYRPLILKDAASLKYSNVAADNPNYKYLQMAVFYGILDNNDGVFDYNQKITRGDMAKALIKLLGYEKLAKATDVFTLPVSDSSEVKKDDVGYIAIAKAIEILEVENNKIRPNENATMVELSSAIYKVLGNLRGGVYY